MDDPTDARASPPANLTVVDATLREESPREDETDEAEDETGEEENEIGERDATSDANDEASTLPSTSTLFSSSSSSSGSDWNTIGPGLIPSVATACLGAFLYGYHSAVINAPLSAIADDLGFAGDNFRKGVIVSVLVAGGFLGGLSIGPLADKEGRRAALAATTVPLAAGTLISAGANSFTTMALGRLITGVGVGASSQIVPLYLSEVSPPELRGTVNGVRRVAYVLGCLLAFQFAVPLQRPVATDVEETRGRVVHADRAAPGLSKNAEDANEAAAKAPVAKAPVAADAKIAPEIAVAAKPSGEPSSAYTVDANVRGESSVAVASPNASKSSQVSGTADPTSIVAVKSTKPSAEAVSTAEGISAAEGVSAAEEVSAASGSSAASAATADRVSEGPRAAAAAVSPESSTGAAAGTAATATSSEGADAGFAVHKGKTSIAAASAESKDASSNSTTAEKAEKTKDKVKERSSAGVAGTSAAFETVDSSVKSPARVRGADSSASSDGTTAATTTPSVAASSSTSTSTSSSVASSSPPAAKNKLEASAAARLEEKPVKKTAAEASKARAKASGERKSVGSDPSASSSASPAGWWRPLFYAASVPAAALAASSLGGVAVESPVWLLGPEGCAVESRRSLAKLLGIRGRAAVRWQEAVSGATGRIAVGPGRAGRVTESLDEDEEEEDANGASVAMSPDGEGAAKSWGQLLERRHRQPVVIGLGLCVLAAFSGSNTVIYYASSVLRDAGVDDPGVLTRAVGVPNLLGGLVALAATDTLGRRPLLLVSFGGMAASLASLALSSALTPGEAVASFCAVPAPEATSGLPCVTCDTLAAICSDLPSPELGGAVRQLEPLRTVALVTIPAYTLFSSLGAGPVPWLLYNEVFPTRIRARATAVCTAINYAANTVVGASFLPLVAAMGLKGTYALYAVSCATGFVFVNTFVFETKGLALQDIEGVMAERESEMPWNAGRVRAEEKENTRDDDSTRGEDHTREKTRKSDEREGWWSVAREKMRAAVARESSVDEGAGTDDEKNAEKRR